MITDDKLIIDEEGGMIYYYLPGKGTIESRIHRDEGPAIIHPEYQEWWQHGWLHRGDDLPALMHANGYKEWWWKGKHHRENGPATIHTGGAMSWWYEGMVSRKDGPAVINSDGCVEWWVDDVRYHTPGTYQKATGMSDEEITLLTLKYGF